MRLDSRFKMIQTHPVHDFTRCCQKNEVPGYPIFWTAIQGTIFHPYQLVYSSHIDRSMERYTTALYKDDTENA